MPPKKNMGGKKGKGRAPQANKRPMPTPISSSDEEEPQGLNVVLKHLAALEKDNAMLKNQLEASQSPHSARPKSARISNKRCLTDPAHQRQVSAINPVTPDEPSDQQAPAATSPVTVQATEITLPSPGESSQVTLACSCPMESTSVAHGANVAIFSSH